MHRRIRALGSRLVRPLAANIWQVKRLDTLADHGEIVSQGPGGNDSGSSHWGDLPGTLLGCFTRDAQVFIILVNSVQSTFQPKGFHFSFA